MDSADNLRKFIAPEYVFGVGALQLVSRFAANFGIRKALLVTDTGVTLAGWAKQVKDELDMANQKYAVYTNVTPNPTAEQVMLGAEMFHTENCNIIIAVGGGSVIDCAKGIGIVSSNKKHILEFVGIDKISFPMPPLICIPTTAGTSADLSQFDIIKDNREQVKAAIISKTVVPDISLVDPATTTTMDPYLTACTGIDALVHALEAFVSNASSYFTDLHAIEATKLISQNLLKSIKEPSNIEVRTKMMLASLQAGLAFSNASLGATHSMSHSLGGFLDLPHGECNAILMAHVFNYNFMSSPERYQKIGEALGLELQKLNLKEKQSAIFTEINSLRIKAGISNSLSTIGVKQVDIPHLAGKAVKDACIVTNPRKATKDDLEVIYGEAL